VFAQEEALIYSKFDVAATSPTICLAERHQTLK
jgi:hypothetical protein